MLKQKKNTSRVILFNIFQVFNFFDQNLEFFKTKSNNYI